MCVSVVTVCLPMGWQQLSQLLHECNKRMYCNQFGVFHFNFEIITDKKSQKTLNYSIFYQYHNLIKWAWHSSKNEKVIYLSSMNIKYINNRVKVCIKFFMRNEAYKVQTSTLGYIKSYIASTILNNVNFARPLIHWPKNYSSTIRSLITLQQNVRCPSGSSPLKDLWCKWRERLSN